MAKEVRYCGECPFFKYEDTYGEGWCVVKCEARECGDECFFLDFNLKEGYRMPMAGAEKVLHHHQKWRKGANVAYLPPKAIGFALDAAIRALRYMKTVEGVEEYFEKK